MRFMSMDNRNVLEHPQLDKTAKYKIMISNTREVSCYINYFHYLNNVTLEKLSDSTLYANVACSRTNCTGA